MFQFHAARTEGPHEVGRAWGPTAHETNNETRHLVVSFVFFFFCIGHPARFEVWNELWGMAGGDRTPACTSQPCIGSTYMSLYNASAVGVKAVHPSLHVGGPSTEHLNTQNFLSQVGEQART